MKNPGPIPNIPYCCFAILLICALLIPKVGISQNRESADTMKVVHTDTLTAENATIDTLHATVLKAGILQVDSIITRSENDLPNSEEKVQYSKPIRIDFARKKISPLPKKLKPGDLYHLQVENINLNLYTVSYNKEDSTIESEVTFPTFEIVGLGELQTLIKELPAVSSISKQLREQKEEEEKKLDKNKDYKIQQKFEKMLEISESLRDTMVCYRWYLTRKSRELTHINQSIDSLSLSIESFALHYLVEEDSTFREDLKSKLDTREILSESRRYREKVKNFTKEVEKRQKEYHAFYKKNKEAIDKEEELKKAHQKITAVFDATLAGADKVFESVSAKQVNAWLNSIIHLSNNTNATYTSLPMQLQGDFTTLDISIKPKKDEFGLSEYHTSLNFPYPPKWHVGAGAAFYVSLWGKLYDKAYSVSSLQVDSTSSEYSVVKEDVAKLEAGIASLIHFRAFTEAEQVNINVAIGPAISLTKPVKPRLTVGVGAIIGEKQQFSLNIIGLAGQVDRLSNKYKPGESYVAHPEEVPENVTVSKFTLGWGFSLGYVYKF